MCKEETKFVVDEEVVKEDFKLLKQLTDVHGCTGFEDSVVLVIKKLLDGIADSLEVDSMGNLFATIKGTTDQTILIDAHSDEIGFQVVLIEKTGLLRIVPVGGQNKRILPGSRVIIHGKEKLLGIIGEMPIHHITVKDRKQTTEIDKLYVDLGFSSKEDVEEFVNIGDFITFDTEAARFNHTTCATGKAFDDRAGCWVLIRTLEMIKKQGSIGPTIVAVFSAQEEIGVRGVTVAAYKVNPDMAIVVEVNHALDYPGAEKNKYGDVSIGEGPIIPLGPNIYPKISRKIIEVANNNNIPIQTQALPRAASNNARIIQITRSGIPVGLITIPLRYMHTSIELLDLVDLRHCAELLYQFLLD